MSAKNDENGNFLIFAQMLVGLGAQELGAEQFDRFVEAAECSDIPVELGTAVSKVLRRYGQDEAEVTSGRCFADACKHLLGLELSGTEASYIVVYSQAIASTKVWLDVEERIEEVRQVAHAAKEALDAEMVLFVEILGCPVEEVFSRARLHPELGVISERLQDLSARVEDYLVEVEGGLIGMSREVANLKLLAQRSCGFVLLTEKQVRGPDKISFAWIWHKIRRAFGRIPTTQRLEELRQQLEALVTDERIRAKILLLSR